MLKKILVLLLIALIVIQFFHPPKNRAAGPQPNHLSARYAVSAEVNAILEKACNDCHSNNTRYPWYSKLQPVDWWMDDHIKEGKKELNLDEYTSRSLRYQYKKLEEISEQVEKGGMPLDSYTWIHKDAKLTENEKKLLISWADGLRADMKAKYPADSLIRKK